MLQQTQVSTVIPYFNRWMKTFPDMESLAASSLDTVLAHWAGLGYYARARNLHRTAGICMEKHGGCLPRDAAELNSLPGIGMSTANAIISQSSDQPAAVLDGNVRRTLARHAAIEGWTGKTSVQRQLWHLAERLLPEQRGADYTQAIMDLGALICTRSNPRCDSCPVGTDCQALLQDRVAELPSPKPRTKISQRTVYMLVLRDEQSRILLMKRPPTGIWGGLWSLPEGDSIESVEAEMGLNPTHAMELPGFEHRLSHVHMLIQPAMATVTEGGQVKCSPEQNWFSADQQSSLGLPRPVLELLERVHAGEQK
jgi:A/G-specific adenine glycosylase